MINFIVQYL